MQLLLTRTFKGYSHVRLVLKPSHSSSVPPVPWGAFEGAPGCNPAVRSEVSELGASPITPGVPKNPQMGKTHQPASRPKTKEMGSVEYKDRKPWGDYRERGRHFSSCYLLDAVKGKEPNHCAGFLNKTNSYPWWFPGIRFLRFLVFVDCLSRWVSPSSPQRVSHF